MRYISTRGGAPPAGFTEALLAALAPDGGLYVPEAYPCLASKVGAALAYPERAAAVLAGFSGGEIEDASALADARAAYAGFASPAVAPLRQLDAGLWLLELFHGPTLAFKDLAMQLLARLYERALEARGGRMTIVCATSGDTGGAAVEAFAGSSRVRLLALFPEGRISEVQRRFMTTNPAGNVRAAAVAGDFDDCQRLLKSLFADRDLAVETALSGVNSINWARIVAQSVYYAAALSALGGGGAEFAVPTGNFGDAFAGEAARRMGWPVERLIVAVNANDILARTFEQGVYRRAGLVPTQSPAMDIQVASNFERLYFELSGRDAPATKRAFEGFAAGGEIALPDSQERRRFTGVSVSEAETAETMRLAHDRYGLLIDPHTAVGLAAGLRTPRTEHPRIVLSTAHPAKFPEAVQAATGRTPPLPEAQSPIWSRKERFDRLPNDLAAVAAYVRSFARE